MTEERIIVPITFQDYEKTAIELARDYANDMEKIERVVGYSEPYRYCVLDMYRRFVQSKKLTKYDELPDEEKGEIVAKSYELWPQQEEKDYFRKQRCVFLYFMNFIFETYFA